MGGVALSSSQTLEEGDYVVVCEIGNIKLSDTLKVFEDEENDLWFPGLGVYFYGEYLNAINRMPKEELMAGYSDMDSLFNLAKWKIGRILTKEDLQKMSLLEVCSALDIPGAYGLRYKEIIFVLDRVGIYIFDPKTNPYWSSGSYTSSDLVKSELAFVYIGTTEQNEILKRNLIENKDLFVNGKLKNPKKWKVVL
jgi:hypothetical protein